MSQRQLRIGPIFLSERGNFSLAFVVQKRYLCTSVSKDGSNDIVLHSICMPPEVILGHCLY